MKKKFIYFMDFPLNIGGANKVLLTQAKIMQQRGHQVLVVIPNDKVKGHAVEYDQICNEYKLRAVTACYSIATCMEQIAIIDVLENYDIMRLLIEEYKPDLIHSTQLNITVELVARELGVPHLMNIYQTDENAFLIDWLNVYPRYHMADSVLLSKRWGSGLGISSRCIRVAYERRKSLLEACSWKEKDFLNIISIGTICERKNQIEIIKFVLMCKYNGYNVQLTLLGKCDEAYEEKCRQYVKENELQDNVIFVGFTLNIEDYLGRADLFILASMVESYPGVLVESMANRIPVVSTPVAGVPELLKDGYNGFLTEGYGASDIYEAFLRLQQYRKCGQIMKIVENAYITYIKHHTYSVVGEQLENYYQWIMEDYCENRDLQLKVEDIAQIFDRFICEKKLAITTEKVRRSIWFLYHVFVLLRKQCNKKVVIWGAGEWGETILEWLHHLGGDEIEIMGFIDMKKQGEYLGYPIIQDRDNVIKECGVIFVAVARGKDCLDIMSYLDKRGKVRNRDYFMVINGPMRI